MTFETTHSIQLNLACLEMVVNEAQLLTSTEFDAIRAGVIAQPLELPQVVKELRLFNTPIARLRAAILFGSANPETSNLLALEVKDDGDAHIALLARLQLLKNETLRHWKGSTDPKPDAQRCVRQLKAILNQIQTLDSNHALHNEVKACANVFAAEASLLAGNPLEPFSLQDNLHLLEAASALRAAAHAMDTLRSRGATGQGLNAGTLNILLQLDLGTEHAVRISDLSALLGVSPRNATGLVDTLERQGFVKRTPDSHDRRAVHPGGQRSDPGAPQTDAIRHERGVLRLHHR